MGAVNPNKLKFTLYHSGRDESAVTHQRLNFGEQNKCHFAQSQNIRPIRGDKKNLATKNQKASGGIVKTRFEDTMTKTLTLGFRGTLKETWADRISADGSSGVIKRNEKKGKRRKEN